MWKSVQCWGREVLAHHHYFPNPAPCDDWLFAHVKKHLWWKKCKSEENINTAVTASEQGWIYSSNWSCTTQMGKACGQCWWFHWREDMCKHSGISVVLLSCILYYNKIICRTSEMAHICMRVCVCVCVYVHARARMCVCVSMCARMYVWSSTWKFFWSSVITPVSKSQEGTDVKVYFLWPTKVNILIIVIQCKIVTTRVLL
jgi:hypothetical protein